MYDPGTEAVTVVPGPPAQSPAIRPTSTLAVVSMVASVASFVIAPFIGAVIGVICGHIARRQIRQTGEAGEGFATAGLLIGYIHLALTGLALLLVVVLVLLVGAAAVLGAFDPFNLPGSSAG